MAAIFKGRDDVIAKLLPGGNHRLAHLSDDELLANTRRLVGKSNQLLAELLAHLAEVEARGVHRTRRCASLYTYCIYELRFSEDAAARRSAAARLVKQFPPLFDAIANGELHLTGLLMIGPHLTPENHVAVLGRAKFRTKKELGKLVRDLNPLPQLPDRIEPLGPEPLRAARNPTWEQYVTSLAPPVRELPPGERPGDWVKEVDVANELDGRACGAGFAAVEGLAAGADFTAVEGSVGIAEVESLGGAPSANGEWISTGDYEQPTASDRFPVGPGPRDLPPVTGPQHYQVQFSTVEEHAQLVERAKALLARTRPGVTLGELHLEAMRLLVASLEKRKFAVPDRINPGSARPTIEIDVRGANEATQPRRRGDDDGSDITPSKGHDRKYGHAHNATVTPRKRRDDNEGCTTPRPRGDGDDDDDDDDETNTTPSKGRDGNLGREPHATATPRQYGGLDENGDDDGSDTPRKSHDGQPGHDQSATAAPCQRGDLDESDARPSRHDHDHDESCTKPRQRDDDGSAARMSHNGQPGQDQNATAAPRQCGGDAESDTKPCQRGDIDRSDTTPAKSRDGKHAHERDAESATTSSRHAPRDVALRRNRHVPAVERREVYRRDGGQCTYVDGRGERCCETRYLELHHLQPFAKNGASMAANLTLRCAAHNALAAEEDFGLPLVTERRNSMRHEALARQQPIAD